MRLDTEKIEELLDRALRGPTHQQMEAARDRVSARLRFERQRGAAAPVQQGDARAPGWWRPVIATAAAVALVAFVVSVGLPVTDRGLYAVLEATDGSMYRISKGNRIPIRVGDRIAAQETLRSNGGAGAVLALADGSRIEIASKSEMWWDRADDGLIVRLKTGSIIVTAATEATGRLYVQTKDMTASVARTTSLVDAAADGSSVAVIEGEAEVQEGGTPWRRSGRQGGTPWRRSGRQGGTPWRRSGRQGTVEKRLGPGQHISTSPTLAARPLKEAIAWSRNAVKHLTVLEAFEKNMARTAGALTPLNQTPAAQSNSGQRATPAAPAFEEASVRLCDPEALPVAPAGGRGGGSGSLQMTPGRLNALCMRVDTLIGHAYSLGPWSPQMGTFGLGNVAARQVRGGPDWIRTDRYTIEAVAEGSANAQTMSGPMLRDLFERRFQLAAHVESEPAPAFALTIAPGGLKMKPATTDACATLPPGAGPLPSDGSVLDRLRRGEPPYCGFIGTGSGPNMIFVAGAGNVPQLVLMLPDVLGTRVIDRTNIPLGTLFNYVLEFAPDERTVGPLGGRGRGRTQTSDEPRAPDIFTAFQEQLGLQLEAVQAPREYVVVDRIERPTPN